MATIISESMLARWETELGPHADALGLSREVFRRADLEYPLELYYRLLEAASRDTANIGMQIGCGMQAPDLGALGHAVAAAPDIGQALGLLATYLYVFAHNNKVRVDEGRDAAVVSYRKRPVNPS